MRFLTRSDAIWLALRFEALGEEHDAFSALGHPDRLLVLAAMVGAGPAGRCAWSIARRAGIGPEVEFHLAFLTRAGLVRRQPRDGWTSYSLVTGAVAELREALRP